MTLACRGRSTCNTGDGRAWFAVVGRLFGRYLHGTRRDFCFRFRISPLYITIEFQPVNDATLAENEGRNLSFPE